MIIDNFFISGAFMTLVTAVVLLFVMNHKHPSDDQD